MITAAARFRLLFGLRYRLLFSGIRHSPKRAILTLLLLLQFVGMGCAFGYTVWHALNAGQITAENAFHAVCLVAFMFEICVGLVGAGMIEFYDTNRLLHLPVRPGEVFAAMVCASTFSLKLLMYAPAVVALVWFSGGGVAAVVARAVIFVVFLAFCQAVTLAFGQTMLLAWGRRRLRDVASVVGAVLGAAMWIAFRSLNTADLSWITGLIHGRAWPWLQLLPSQWFARVLAGGPTVVWMAPACVVALAGALWAGARLFGRTFEAAGETGDGGAVVTGSVGTAFSFLGGDIGAVVRQTLKIIGRDPQLRNAAISQLMMPLMVVISMSLTARPDADDANQVMGMLTMMCVFGHIVFAFGLMSVDGRGVGAILASPMPRHRMLAGRAVAMYVIFTVSNAVIIPGLLAGRCLVTHAWADWPRQVGISIGAAAVGDALLLACGAIISVLAPAPITHARRSSRGRMGKNPLGTAMLRMFGLVPVGLLAAAIIGVGFLPVWVPVDRRWLLATIPAAAATVLLLVVLGVGMGARLMRTREDRFLAMLSDSGE